MLARRAQSLSSDCTMSVRFFELLLVDGQLRLEVVDEYLLPLDHLPGSAVAHRPHERVQFAV